MDKQTINRYILALQTQAKKVKADDFDLHVWKSVTAGIVGKIFGTQSPKIAAINAIEHVSDIGISGYIYRSNMDECKRQATALMQEYINELKMFGLEKKSVDVDTSSAANTNTDKQENTPLLNYEFIQSCLQYELTGKQYQALQQLLQNTSNGNNKEERAAAIADKIKSFGADVAAEILAKILLEVKV